MKNKRILTIYGCTGVHGFLRDHFICSSSFNYPVIVDDSVTSCCEMFTDCDSYNQVTIIHNSVTSCQGIFSNCKAYNQPIVIPNSVINCKHMFCDGVALDQDIVVPNSVVRRVGMFENCKKMQHRLAEGKTTNFSFSLTM